MYGKTHTISAPDYFALDQFAFRRELSTKLQVMRVVELTKRDSSRKTAQEPLF